MLAVAWGDSSELLLFQLCRHRALRRCRSESSFVVGACCCKHAMQVWYWCRLKAIGDAGECSYLREWMKNRIYAVH